MSNDFYQLDLITSVENIISSSNQYDFGTSNHTLKWLHTFKNETNLTGTLVRSLYRPKNLFPEIDSDNVISFESKIDFTSVKLEYLNNKKTDFNFYSGIEVNRYQVFPGNLNPGFGNSINPVSLSKEDGYETSFYSNLNFNLGQRISLSSGIRLTQFSLLGPYAESQYDSNNLALQQTFLIIMS